MPNRTARVRVVRGEITFPPDTPAVKPARVTVSVEDVSRADAPSQVVGEASVSLGALRAGSSVPFSLRVPASRIDDRHSYSLRVHVDMSGSGEVERGDLITVQSYPVLTRGHGDEARVEVKLV